MSERTRGEGKGGGAGGMESVPAQCCQALIPGFDPALNTSHINTAH